jgi:transposase
MRRAYQSDLSDAEWDRLAGHFPAPKATGRSRLHELREITDAICFYVLKSGCAWRLLPHDFPTAGRPSTITSALGAWTEPGKRCTQPYARGCGCG